MADPVLSVVVPVYNRAGSIGRTVASVLASAAHGGVAADEVELVVVDDGSVDGSGDAAQAAADQADAGVDVTVVRQANAGPAAARNLGAARARARHIAFLDSDDVWFEWTSTACLRALRAHPEAAMFFLKPCVFSHARPLDPRFADDTSFDVHDGFISARLAHGMRSFGTNNVVVRRDVFERLNGFAVEFRCLEDTDFFLRADPEGPCVVLEGDDLLGRQRGERDNLTDNWRCVVDGLCKMKRKERAGLYPKGRRGDPRRLPFLGGTAVRATRLCFANGEWPRAYGVFFANFGLILQGGRSRWLWRLPLTPLLWTLRPLSFPFRPRPVPPGDRRTAP